MKSDIRTNATSSSNHNLIKGSGKRKAVKVDSEFICQPIFRNNLPNAPSGPYFKQQLGFKQSFERFAEFKVSSLEKNFVWQPHFSRDIGVNLDLVDQDTILALPTNTAADPADLKFLVSADRKAKTRGSNNQEKPWWLRNTIYLENNLYNVRVAKDENKVSIKRSKVDDVDPFSIEYIDQSFDKVVATESRLKESKIGSDIVWSLPIFPDTGFEDDEFLLSMVRFDEDIAQSVEGMNQKRGGCRQAVDSIITNPEKYLISDASYSVSLVTKVDGDTFSTGEVSRVDEDKSVGQLYEWVSDFRMRKVETAPTSQLQELMLMVDSVEGTMRYKRIHRRFDMRKLVNDSEVCHELYVSRCSHEVNVDKTNT